MIADSSGISVNDSTQSSAAKKESSKQNQTTTKQNQRGTGLKEKKPTEKVDRKPLVPERFKPLQETLQKSFAIMDSLGNYNETSSNTQDDTSLDVSNRQKREKLEFLSFASPLHPAPDKIDVIIIDAGHGGKDPGAEFYGFKEKDLSLLIARELETVLKKKIKKEKSLRKTKVLLTRKRDESVSLEKRAHFANQSLFEQ